MPTVLAQLAYDGFRRIREAARKAIGEKRRPRYPYPVRPNNKDAGTGSEEDNLERAQMVLGSVNQIRVVEDNSNDNNDHDRVREREGVEEDNSNDNHDSNG